MPSEADRHYMARALELAERGLYTTTPNPRVGCVIVRDGAVVGEGWHQRAGEAHAEVIALRAAGEKAQDATVYVTLEPCSYHGRTPPCTQALLAGKVNRVVAAMQDPNPRVAGQGLQAIRAAGIAAECGLMEAEALELNVGFVSRMTRGRPWLRMKIAASLDGKTALTNGRSQWITGADARRDGHRWRARACVIMTGIGTVREDDPQLTVRDVDTSRQPIRLVVDSRLEIATNARVLGTGSVVAAAVAEQARSDALRAKGTEVIVLPTASGKVDLHALMQELGRREMNEVHVEAGYKLNGSLLREGLVDELLIYLAPHILGDTARGMFHMPELTDLSERLELDIRDVASVGSDIRVIARPKADR
ncbi:MAG TPA: bifunctional diaminohydroxyphosphoribosylaminopyrimidine deaminase/5-amino-6-(5-phosphoribosylamino)uracil reductase RibD [Burkholderiales bacterium]|nr:bifunctional diaminohydroxyphosphoribosylaminopyrimidine deaminase/5-amino-6-(5-phosphoribosylamino)uracil reductase RibD [Burkholderiales bacterium]